MFNGMDLIPQMAALTWAAMFNGAIATVWGYNIRLPDTMPQMVARSNSLDLIPHRIWWPGLTASS